MKSEPATFVSQPRSPFMPNIGIQRRLLPEIRRLFAHLKQGVPSQ